MMSGKKPYLPNNWQQWKEVPDEFLYAPTFEEFADWKLSGWELPSSICYIIRETTDKGKIRDHIYQKRYAAENKIKNLIKSGNEFVVCTEDELHSTPKNTDEPDYD